MIGRIIDMNNTDAFVSFKDGTTMDVSISRLPKDSEIGDDVDIDLTRPMNMLNDKMVDFF